ncbi:MAG TPA: DUF4235 domain-containing protein [Jatrophihabitantaceae bacterium]|nr:DUF4235 domain-containing protein [Jatrophihabitantaceae bacterium]
MWNAISKVMYRILTVLVAIPVTRAVSRMVTLAWRAARPQNPQHNAWRHDTRIIDAITWSMIVGAGRATRRLVTTKASAELWRAVIGTEPPPVASKRAKMGAE